MKKTDQMSVAENDLSLLNTESELMRSSSIQAFRNLRHIRYGWVAGAVLESGMLWYCVTVGISERGMATEHASQLLR
jgi:hypothetical protein